VHEDVKPLLCLLTRRWRECTAVLAETCQLAPTQNIFNNLVPFVSGETYFHSLGLSTEPLLLPARM
jgi:hypothetical protein